MKKSGCLKIGYDFSNDKDVSCLVVIEKREEDTQLLILFMVKRRKIYIRL